VIADPSRAKEEAVRGPVSRQEILRDFKELIAEGRLLGAAHDPSIIDSAEFDPNVVRKKGKGTRFLIRKVPSAAKLLKLWQRFFGNRISPRALFEALSARTHGFDHRDNVLLFGKGWIMYDTEIFRAEEGVGELTLSFESVRDLTPGFIASLLAERLKVVRVEHIRLTAQQSGYASTLFRDYERLFRDLGFDQFRLSASLSVGKYYWAKEGFDFSDESEIGKRRAQLLALVKERNLPVTEAEIERLNHAYDFPAFKREVRIAAYRDAEGYYWLNRDDPSCEKVFLPLGKAFLLSGSPWEGYKTISTRR
jgi:hypothetical protein